MKYPNKYWLYIYRFNTRHNPINFKKNLVIFRLKTKKGKNKKIIFKQ